MLNIIRLSTSCTVSRRRYRYDGSRISLKNVALKFGGTEGKGSHRENPGNILLDRGPKKLPRRITSGLALIALLELCFLEFATTSDHQAPSLFRKQRRLRGIARAASSR